MVATVPNFTDLTKLPPKAGTFFNDTRVPNAPKVPKASIGSRVGAAAGNFVKKLPIRTAGALAVPFGMALDRNSAPEDRFFPKVGGVLDSYEQVADKAYEEGGLGAGLNETRKMLLPAAGGLTLDVADKVRSLFGGGEGDLRGFDLPYDEGAANLGPGIQLTPGAAEGIKTGIPYKAPPVVPAATSAAAGPATTSGSKFDDLLLAQLGGQDQPKAEAAPARSSNESYFINNQTGVAPGEKQYFKDLPGTTLNDPQPQAGLPQRLPTAQGQGSTYQSPLAAATENLNLARFDDNDSYSDLLGKRLHNIGEGQSLIPASARTAESAERQRRGEVDREFGLDSLELSQNKEYDDNNLALGRDELVGRDRRSNIDNLVRLRGQDVVSETSKANANTRAAATPLSFEDQVSEQDALIELNLRDFTGAPTGFPEAAVNFMHGGASRSQVRNAYNKVSAEQAAKTGTPANELDAQKLYDAVARELKQ